MSDASPYQDGVAPGQMPSNGGVTQRSHPNPSKRVRLDLGPDDDGLESEQTTPVEGPAQHVVAISREEKGLLPIASVFRGGQRVLLACTSKSVCVLRVMSPMPTEKVSVEDTTYHTHGHTSPRTFPT